MQRLDIYRSDDGTIYFRLQHAVEHPTCGTDWITDNRFSVQWGTAYLAMTRNVPVNASRVFTALQSFL